jgi:hypothetical protein
MPNGKYEPQCGNCIHWDQDRPGRRYCALHDFVMPAFEDYVLCSDWKPRWTPKGVHPIVQTTSPGLLWRWNEHDAPLRPVGRFEEVQELLLDRPVSIVEDPERGWAIYLPRWDEPLYPGPGESVRVDLDGAPEAFSIADLAVAVMYTRRQDDGSLQIEERAETVRAALPTANAGRSLVDWIERHHGLAQARRNHDRNLRNPRFMNKNKPLRLREFMTGKPDRREYRLRPGMGVALFP